MTGGKLPACDVQLKPGVATAEQGWCKAESWVRTFLQEAPGSQYLVAFKRPREPGDRRQGTHGSDQ